MASKMRGAYGPKTSGRRPPRGNVFTDTAKSTVDERGQGLAGAAARGISGRQAQIDAQLDRMYRGQSTDSNN